MRPNATLTGLAPALTAQTHTVILGSFPGVVSLKQQGYYAHPRNAFWPIMEAVLAQPLLTLAYPERISALLDAGYGLWDVYASCERSGSLDAAIRQPQLNPLKQLIYWCPQLSRIVHNGQTSGRLAPLTRQLVPVVLILPSTSPANARLSLEQKIIHWQSALQERQTASR